MGVVSAYHEQLALYIHNRSKDLRFAYFLEGIAFDTLHNSCMLLTQEPTVFPTLISLFALDVNYIACLMCEGCRMISIDTVPTLNCLGFRPHTWGKGGEQC